MKQFFKHAVVIGYLMITFSAFVFTMTLTHVRLLPYAWFHWSYGMMSPYQGDVPWNKDLIVEGELLDGQVERIDLARSMPYGFGERNVRTFLRMFSNLPEHEYREKFTQWGALLLDRERARGKPYVALHLRFDQWERSPGGYEFLHLPLFTTKEFVTDVR